MSFKEKVLNQIQAMKDEIVEIHRNLVKIRSINPPGEYEEIAAFLVNKMREFGFEAETVEAPREKLEELNLETPRINVLGRWRGEKGQPTLILNAHTDVVPVGSGWTVHPFEAVVKDRKIYGRGAMDCKGGIAASLMAILALKQVGIRLNGDVIFAWTVDEETGGLAGPKYLIEKGILKGDYCMVAEPLSDFIVHATNGVLHLEITTEGQTAHASMPELGVNAINKMNKVISALISLSEKYEGRRSRVEGIEHPTLVVGTISGGLKTNVVPDRCTITIDRRIIPEENTEDVKKEISDLIDQLKRDDPKLKVRTKEILVADPMLLPTSDLMVQLTRKYAREVLGKDLPIKGIPGFTDARFFSGLLKIPTCLFGPGRIKEGRPHGPDENVRIEDLINATRFYALLAMEVLGFS